VADGCCSGVGVGEGVGQLWMQTWHWLIVKACRTAAVGGRVHAKAGGKQETAQAVVGM
jgi:hypothetical protein